MNFVDVWNSSSYNAAAFLIALTSIFYTLLRGRTARKQNKLFIMIIFAILLSSICATASIFSEAAIPYDEGAKKVIYVVEYLYFIGHTALGPLMFYYSLYVCDADEDIGNRAKYLLLLPGLIAEVLVLINPFTHLVYYIDDHYHFQRGPLEVVLYLMAGFYAVFSAVILFRYRKTTSFERKVSVVCFYGLTAAGMLVQMVTKTVRLELFAEALSVMGLMFSVENEDSGIDLTTGVRNRDALKNDLERYFGRERPFEIIAVRLMDVVTLQRIMGFSGFDAVPCMVAEYLKSIHPAIHIYRAAPEVFLLVIPREGGKAEILKNKIIGRFAHSFRYYSFEGMLRYYLIHARVPEDLNSLSELLLTADLPIPASVPSHILEGENLSYLLRNAALEKAIRESDANHSLYVEYLDIYDTVTGEVASREATLLLKDEKLGVVYPEEFLPVARQCNKMEELGKLLLGTAFRDFGENRDQDPTAKRLNVNLFSVFLAEEDLGSLLRAECRENNVRPEDVTIEITESDAADNRETVKSAISELREMGFKVALDDYGAGYSNIQEMFMLPFDEVKLSGGLLAEAGKNAVSDAVLESNVAMLRRMGFPIMAEGVDTEEQARIVKKLSVDFYQRTYQGGAA